MNFPVDAQRLIELLTERGRMKGKDIAAALGLDDDADVRKIVGYIKDNSLALIGSKRSGRDCGYWIGTPEETAANNKHIRKTALVSLIRCRRQIRLAERLMNGRLL